MKTGIAAALALVCLTPSAHAHNGAVHQNIVELAAETMRLVTAEMARGGGQSAMLNAAAAAGGPKLPGTQGLDATNAPAFAASIQKAWSRLLTLPSGLPQPPSTCPDAWTAKQKLGEVGVITRVDSALGTACGDDATSWAPGGLFNRVGDAAGSRTLAGMTLGAWAAAVDYRNDDTHLWSRPTSWAGIGAAKAAASKVVTGALAVAFVPLICGLECIFGSCDDCMSKGEDIADDANLIPYLDGLIPGIGDVSDGTTTTMWHFINLTPGRTELYDDHQGLLYEEAGYHGVPDVVDLAVMLAADVSGLSYNYSKSEGIDHYEILSDSDGHRATHHRSKAQWQFSTIGHTVAEPLDNLAYYGWHAFRADPNHAVSSLGWPLHAIGDAAAPHHVIGSSGYGHRPFEDAVERSWWSLRYLPFSGDGDGNLEAQRLQVQRILVQAFHWRNFIAAWRAAHPGHTVEVPIRDLITAVAQSTYDEAEARSGWPFDPLLSAQYLINSDAATTLYEGDANIDKMRPLIDRAAGATLALLIASTEGI
jgi:hypothetical protein